MGEGQCDLEVFGGVMLYKEKRERGRGEMGIRGAGEFKD